MASYNTQPVGQFSGANGSSIPIPNGQMPLSALPQYGGAGGSLQAAQAYAGLQFSKTFGRNPTQQELDQLAPSYMGADPNIANVAGGNAAVAAYFNSISNSPTQVAAQQQQKAVADYNANPTKFNDATASVFQQMLGRSPTDAEQQHFGALFASGQIDQYGMQSLLGQSQEYQQAQANKQQTAITQQNQQFLTGLSGNLQQTQSDYYKNYILPQIQEQMASQGQSVGNSGFANALAQAAKQQNYGLQQYLAQVASAQQSGTQGFAEQQYGNTAQNQQAVYQQYLDNLYGRQNADITNQIGQQNYMQQRNNQLSDYQMQQQAYNNYLQQYGKRNGLINDVGTALNFTNAALNLGRGGANAFGSGDGMGNNIGSSGFNSTAYGTQTWGPQGNQMYSHY